MTRQQITVITLAILTFLVMYFGCETKTIAHKSIEKSRMLAAEVTDVTLLIQEAKKEMKENQIVEIELLEQEVNQTIDSSNIDILKKIAGKWYEVGYPAISGHYAEEIAGIVNDADSWSIAGSTYAIGMKNAQDEKIKIFCSERAISSFENAISLDPSNVLHQANLALCYTERPPSDNPMKGIQMLLGLDDKFPNNPVVLNNLATLAIKTGQYDKALARVKSVLQVDPKNKEANCLSAIVYQEMGDAEKASYFKAICEN